MGSGTDTTTSSRSSCGRSWSAPSPTWCRELLERAAGWCEANELPETAIGYAQAAGDVDRVARLVERCTMPAYQSGRVATAERWLDWLEGHGALERNAAVAVLGATGHRDLGSAGRGGALAEAAERATYEGTLSDGSQSIAAWLALLRALRCPRGATRMRADAELATGTLDRRSPFRPTAVLLLAIAEWLAGEVDRADDLLADVAEEAWRSEGPSRWRWRSPSAPRSRSGAAPGSGPRSSRAGRSGSSASHGWTGTPPAHSPMRWLRASHCTASDAASAHALLARTQTLRLRLTYALPYLAVQTRLELARAYLAIADAGGARTMLREIEAVLRRQPDLGVLPAQVEEVRLRLKTMRADAPGASSMTAAELRMLPYLATHLSFPEIGQRLYLSRHTVKSHAMAIYRKLNVTSPHRRGPARPRGRAPLGEPSGEALMPSGR